MRSKQEDASISIAERIAEAIALGDLDEAVRLTRDLKRALTNASVRPADEGPSFDLDRIRHAGTSATPRIGRGTPQ